MKMIINTLDFKDTLSNFGKKFWEEVLDLLHDFVDVFDVIKTHTWDILCKQFGETVVSLFGLTLLFLVIILVALKIIFVLLNPIK